ncbi:MAG TPA: hypothetical protein VFB44_16105 [Thermoleophilaceae bacterium]|nr:hypothetical protein [Thermoleophilaceae bacterium]
MAAAAVPAAIAGPLLLLAARLSVLGLASLAALREPVAFACGDPVDFARVDPVDFARVDPVDFARVDPVGFALVVARDPSDELAFACLLRLPALLPADFVVAMRATFLREPSL